MTKWTFKKWQKVKIDAELDIHHGKIGVIIGRSLKQGWPYTICFGQTDDGCPVYGIYQRREIKKML